MDIHIFWEGPFSISQLKDLECEDQDYGIYQIYGQHAMYGNSVLLYIGQANDQTFGKRISQENWAYGKDPNNIQIYIGRLAGHQSISGDGWSARITSAEKLLIYSHQPVYNVSNKNSIPEKMVLSNHILNWGAHRSLFPEISGKRYTESYDHISENNIYSASTSKT